MDQPILPNENQYKKYSKKIGPFLQNQKTKNYSTVIFFFLVLAVFGWYAIRPTIQTILYLQREIKDKVEVDKKMDAKIYALIEAYASFENNEKLLPVLSEAVPHTPEALDIVSQIQTIATEKRISISTLQMTGIPLATLSSALKPKDQKRFTEIPIMFTIEGTFPSVVAFLTDLTTLRRVVSIQSMNFIPIKTSIVSASESGTQSSVKVLINLLTYYETK
jgi:Tfp pilus assembly protein PilO